MLLQQIPYLNLQSENKLLIRTCLVTHQLLTVELASDAFKTRHYRLCLE